MAYRICVMSPKFKKKNCRLVKLYLSWTLFIFCGMYLSVFTRSKCHKLSFPFYVFFYVMMICLCDMVMLLGSVYMITLLVLTNNVRCICWFIYLLLPIYTSCSSFIFLFIKRFDLPLTIKG